MIERVVKLEQIVNQKYVESLMEKMGDRMSVELNQNFDKEDKKVNQKIEKFKQKISLKYLFPLLLITP